MNEDTIEITPSPEIILIFKMIDFSHNEPEVGDRLQFLARDIGPHGLGTQRVTNAFVELLDALTEAHNEKAKSAS